MSNQSAAAGGEQLERGIGLWGAISANVLNMVGVGPFLTIPLALAAMGGPQAMVGWLFGALLCLCDGLVWAELGSRYPVSGGSYHYLLEAFGPHGFGRLVSFLFLWQALLTGPLSIASGAVGFAEYANFLLPHLQHWHLMVLAVCVCLLNLLLLYRNIRSIVAISVAITIGVFATCLWIIVSGAFHFHPALAFDFPPNAFQLSRSFWMGLGSASLIAVYDYGGYNNVCMIGGEVKQPRRTIPRAVIFSIVLVAALYLLMNLSILGSVPWRQGQYSKAIVADYMQLLYGHWAGVLASVLILLVSWGSVFANLLGYSRVPYAAAVDGHFFRPFARLHPVGGFPTVSLIAIGVLSAVACLFSLADLISVLIVVQIMFQFLAQCVGLVLLRRQKGVTGDSFRMPLYPFPVVIAILGWLYIMGSSSVRHVAVGLAMAIAGSGVYLLQARRNGEWPFEAA